MEKYEYLRIWKAEKKKSTNFDVWNRIVLQIFWYLSDLELFK